MRFYRHGDVILVSLPEDTELEGKPEKHLNLALGEVTGHAHRISEGKAKLYKFDPKFHENLRRRLAGDMNEPAVEISHLVEVKSKRAALTHEEHNCIDLPSGNYAEIVQRDYKPGGWTKVID